MPPVFFPSLRRMPAESIDTAPPPDPWSAPLERVLFDAGQIRARVAEMGARLTADYAGKPLTIVTILQGGAVFMADLIREIHLPLTIESLSVASYHGETESSGRVTFHQSRLPAIDGRHVLVLDDILDSGRTLSAILDRLRTERAPLSLRTVVLLSKRIERAAPIEADYAGFEIGGEFIVGYGLDYRGEFRNLPMIGVLKTDRPA